MKRTSHRESGSILKTALTVLLLLGTIAFILHTANENGLLGNPTNAMISIESQVAPPPVVDFDEIRAHRRFFPDYGLQVEQETVASYNELNSQDTPWYKNGLTAARIFGGFAALGDFYGEGLLYTSLAHAKIAYQKGCRDPLVLSICDIYRYKNFYSTSPEEANKHLENIARLGATKYPAIVKLEAEASGFEDLAYVKKKKITGMEQPLARVPELYQKTLATLRDLLQTNVPEPIIYGVVGDLYDAMQEDPAILVQAGPAIEALLKQHKLSPAMEAACQGNYLISLAWASRGSGWAESVQPEGWAGMASALNQAEQIITSAYEKYPTDARLPTLMLQVELGQGKGTARMNDWFEKAIAIDPDYFRAYAAKCYYLQPRWYGSLEEVTQFGLECVKTGKWDQLIPLVYVENIATMAKQTPEIYKDDKLWASVESTYEEYLKLYPRSLCYRTNYLNAAALAGKWDTVRKQLKILGGHWEQLSLSKQRMAEIRSQLAAATASAP